MSVIRDGIIAFEAQWKPLKVSSDDSFFIITFSLPPSECDASITLFATSGKLFQMKAKIDGYSDRPIAEHEKVSLSIGVCKFYSFLGKEEQDSILQFKMKFEHFKLGTDEKELFHKANLLVVLKDVESYSENENGEEETNE